VLSSPFTLTLSLANTSLAQYLPTIGREDACLEEIGGWCSPGVLCIGFIVLLSGFLASLMATIHLIGSMDLFSYRLLPITLSHNTEDTTHHVADPQNPALTHPYQINQSDKLPASKLQSMTCMTTGILKRMHGACF
jgi:hypothetical protein